MLRPDPRVTPAGLLLALLVIPLHVAAHDDLAGRASRLDTALAADADEPTLWLQRASLRTAEGDAEGALADLERAAEAGAEPGALQRARGLALLAADRPSDAAAALASALEGRPDDAFVRAARARALEACGRGQEAAAEYERALSDAPDASAAPDWVLGRARTLTSGSAPDLDGALRALEEGSILLGRVPAFEQAALGLELRAGRVEAALARLDRMAAAAPRPEGFLVQRGEILEAARRSQQARAAYAAALAAMEDLSPQRRATPAAVRLAQRAREGVARTQGEGAK